MAFGDDIRSEVYALHIGVSEGMDDCVKEAAPTWSLRLRTHSYPCPCYRWLSYCMIHGTWYMMHLRSHHSA